MIQGIDSVISSFYNGNLFCPLILELITFLIPISFQNNSIIVNNWVFIKGRKDESTAITHASIVESG